MSDGVEESLREIAKSLQSIDTRLGLLLLNTEASRLHGKKRADTMKELDELTKSEEEYLKSRKMLGWMGAGIDDLENDPRAIWVVQTFWEDEKNPYTKKRTFGDLSNQLWVRHGYVQTDHHRNNKIKEIISEAVESGDIEKDESIEAYLGAKNFREANKVPLDFATTKKILPLLTDLHH